LSCVCVATTFTDDVWEAAVKKSYHVDVSHKAQGVIMKHEPAIHCTSYPTKSVVASSRPRKDLKHRYMQHSVRSGITAYIS